MSPSVVTIGDWVVDRDTNSIRREEESRKLQPLSIDVLLYLAEHADRLVSSQELLDTLWPRRVVGDDAVHRRIANLRKMLGDSSRNPKYIRTVSKRGYRLIASVGQPEATGTPGSAHRRLRTKAVAVLLIVVALFMAAQIQRLFGQHGLLLPALVSAESFTSEDQYQATFVELAPFRDKRDAEVAALFDALARPVSIHTDSPGVEIAYRFTSLDSGWTSLGVMPLTDFRSLLVKRFTRAGSGENCWPQLDARTIPCPSFYSFSDAAALPAKP